ncbi:MAG: permease, partial [Micromonosporaceae bacterium]|nr:permease [Micromonosporaceae bacterium]
AGVAVVALAAPASLRLSWSTTPWLLVSVAVAIGATGLSARTGQAAVTHTAAAGLVGLVGAGAALARPGLMALVLTAITLAGVLIAVAERFTGGGGGWASFGRAPTGGATGILAGWAAGGAAFALPGAVAAGVATVADTATPVLTTTALAVCAALGYAALDQVAHRQVSVPLAVGGGLAAVALATAAFRTADTSADIWVAALLLAGAVLLFLAPSIDARRRADRNLDGPDIAAGVVTAATVASLARIGALALPGSELATTAALVLVVAFWVRALPEDWRRGPALGSAASGAVIAAIAGYAALRDGIRVLSLRGDIWAADLDAWPAGPGGQTHWQTPVALLLLAAAAAVVLPRPASYDVAAAGVGLATIGAPLALGLAWWSPIALGLGVAVPYAISSVLARDPRAGVARAVLATVLALHAAGASLVRPWTTAVTLGVIALLGTVVATLAVLVSRLDLGIVDDSLPGGTAHLPVIGGAGVTAALLALPGTVVAAAAELDRPAGVVLTTALGASSIGLAVVAAVRRQVPHYLGYATAGVAGGATGIAIAALPSDQPAGLYAAAAVLLGVIAELQRAESVGADGRGGDTSSWRSTFSEATGGPFVSSLSSGSQGAQRLADGMVQVSDGMLRRWRIGPVRQLSISPVRGALVVSAVPTALALAMIVPALVTALVDPYQTLDAVWGGPPPALLHPTGGDRGSVLAALLLTIAAALAAVGFSGGSPAQAIPVVLPGLAITLLIAPVALGANWPASTLACLAVFTLSSLGVALTPPPPYTDQARPVRVARVLVFFIGLSAGGSGLAGSLATRSLTLFTLGGAVCVGATAALGGRTQLARILGWLFATASALGFVLTLGRVLGLASEVSAFGVLAVGAALLVMTATLPRLRRPEAYQETATVEWSGYAAALLALALAVDSPLHVAALLAAWGAVLGLAATRPNRGASERRALFWTTVACEIGAWWLLMRHSEVVLIEAYTVPFAVLALAIGVLEARRRPDLSSWAAYGPALVAAFLPTLTIVLFSSAGAPRHVGLLLGAVGVLIAGSVRRQQAPVMVGAVVTAITALRLLTEYGPWLILIPVGLTLLLLGANYEKRRRDIQRLRATLTSFR